MLIAFYFAINVVLTSYKIVNQEPWLEVVIVLIFGLLILAGFYLILFFGGWWFDWNRIAVLIAKVKLFFSRTFRRS